MKPGAQGRHDAVGQALAACRRVAELAGDFYSDPLNSRANRAMRRKLVAAMRRAVREVVSSERKAGR